MDKIDMTYANYKIYKTNIGTSNKNLLSDLLNETAKALNFNMLLLREDFSNAKGYLFDEDDLDLLAEMALQAKSAAGKRIRCNDFSITYAAVIDFFINAFMTLAVHNGVPAETIFKSKYQMLARTNFVTIKNSIKVLTNRFDEDLEKHFFFPNDFHPNDDDELTPTDTFTFLMFILENIDLDIKNIRGIYIVLVEKRQSECNKSMINFLHSMDKNQTAAYLGKTKQKVLFELKLQEDEDYSKALSEFVRIECGGGKLQERKKIVPLLNKLCEIMDRNAEVFIDTEEYTFGEPEFKKPHPINDNIISDLAESQSLLNNSIQFYNSLKIYREKQPLTPGDETMLEYFYEQRFDETMF